MFLRSALRFGLLGIALVGASVSAGGPADTEPGEDPLPPGALARMGSFRFRNATPINADLSPDGRLFAVAAPENQIRLLDAATGKEVRRLATDLDLPLIELGAGKRVRISVTNLRLPLVFSPDGKSLAADGQNERQQQIIQLYDVATTKKLRQFETSEQSALKSFFFSSDGNVLVGFRDGYQEKAHFFVWEVATGKLLGQFDSPPGNHNRAAVSPDGKTLVCWQQAAPLGDIRADKQALALDQTILGWHVTTGKESIRFRVEWGYPEIRRGCFSPDGRTLALVTGRSTIEIWDPYAGKQVRRLVGRDGLGAFLTFSPDGKTILAETV